MANQLGSVHNSPPAAETNFIDYRTMADQSASPLFKLPPELRNAVCGMVFEGSIVEVDYFESTKVPNAVNLLLTAKQPYSEAVQVYYSNVIVQSECQLSLEKWANVRRPKYYHLIPELRISYFAASNVTKERAMAIAENVHQRDVLALTKAKVDLTGKRVSVKVKYEEKVGTCTPKR